jgi:DNA-binding XRE family transcriptional regulator
MSDLLYYITAVTKGKKPKVVFLKDEVWLYNVRDGVDMLELPEAKRTAKHEPTHCLFVEAHDGLQTVLKEIFDKKDSIDAEKFYKIVEELGCETVSTSKKKKSKIEKESNPVNKTKPKIRLAYVLCCSINNKPIYYCEEDMSLDISANLHIYINNGFAKVFRTYEEAEFYNEVWTTNNPNNTKKMYVKEIAF